MRSKIMPVWQTELLYTTAKPGKISKYFSMVLACMTKGYNNKPNDISWLAKLAQVSCKQFYPTPVYCPSLLETSP